MRRSHYLSKPIGGRIPSRREIKLLRVVKPHQNISNGKQVYDNSTPKKLLAPSLTPTFELQYIRHEQRNYCTLNRLSFRPKRESATVTFYCERLCSYKNCGWAFRSKLHEQSGVIPIRVVIRRAVRSLKTPTVKIRQFFYILLTQF